MKNLAEVDILAIGVHPDDVELSCSGTLLKQKSLGYTVGLLDLTLGELGTRGNAQIRTEEAMLAATLLGASYRYQLDFADGFFEWNKNSILSIIEIIRMVKPKIVLTNALSDRHPDHGRASKLISDACFYSGLVKVETMFDGHEQLPYRPNVIYHFIQDHQLKPDFVVNIDGFMEKKMALIECFKSQFYSLVSNEPESPISGKDFLEVVRANARVFGRSIKAEFGEGFNVERTIGVQDIFDLQ